MLQEATDFLEEVKKKGGVAHGAIWWMERTLTGIFVLHNQPNNIRKEEVYASEA